MIQQLAEGLLHSACHCGPALPTLAFGINAIKLRLSVLPVHAAAGSVHICSFDCPNRRPPLFIFVHVCALEQKSDWLIDRWDVGGAKAEEDTGGGVCHESDRDD